MTHAAQAAPGPDLFGDTPAPRPPQLEFIGTLAAAPVIRTRSEHGHPVPVLCLELAGVGPHGNTLHAELPFADTPAARKTAEAQAQQLHPGQRVAVSTPIAALRLVLPQATHVALAVD